MQHGPHRGQRVDLPLSRNRWPPRSEASLSLGRARTTGAVRALETARLASAALLPGKETPILSRRHGPLVLTYGPSWCGPRGSKEYCAAPDCQINFGSGCDGNQVPNGASTASIARPHVGNVPYGGLGIYNCVVNGDIAITFDDGPYTFTADLLDKFKAHNATATFFITGNNLGKGMINDPSTPWPGVIRVGPSSHAALSKSCH